jgi:hypothetical protein
MIRATALVFAILIAGMSSLALAATTTAGAAAASTSAKQTRDWSAIDTNKDNYISPSEMQTYLDKVWQQEGKKG